MRNSTPEACSPLFRRFKPNSSSLEEERMKGHETDETRNSLMEKSISVKTVNINMLIYIYVWVEASRFYLEWCETINVIQKGARWQMSPHSTRLTSPDSLNNHVKYARYFFYIFTKFSVENLTRRKSKSDYWKMNFVIFLNQNLMHIPKI